MLYILYTLSMNKHYYIFIKRSLFERSPSPVPGWRRPHPRASAPPPPGPACVTRWPPAVARATPASRHLSRVTDCDRVWQFAAAVAIDTTAQFVTVERAHSMSPLRLHMRRRSHLAENVCRSLAASNGPVTLR